MESSNYLPKSNMIFLNINKKFKIQTSLIFLAENYQKILVRVKNQDKNLHAVQNDSISIETFWFIIKIS